MGKSLARRGGNPITVKRGIAKTYAQCPDCKTKYPVYRTIRSRRRYEEGHLKDLWCYVCKGEKKFVQLSSTESKYN